MNGPWSRWDNPVPGVEGGEPKVPQRFFEQILRNPSIINLPKATLVDYKINTIDDSFFDCEYSVPGAIDNILKQCYKDTGCCANACCPNTDWKEKYGWAVALICLFCILVIFAFVCWTIVWLVQRRKDKIHKRQLVNCNSISPATSQISLAYQIPNGYHFGTGPYQTPPLNYPTKY